jgi:GT2 family glycosyltransferase
MALRSPKIAVIIPLYKYAGIETVIDSITCNTYPNVQIIVIDNSPCSEHELPLLAKMEKSPDLHYYRQNTNLGVTGGRNKGIQYIDPDCEFVLFLDHDVLLREDCLANLVNDFENIEARGSIGILTGKVYYKGQQDYVWAAGTDINLYSGQIQFYTGKDGHQFDGYRKVGVAPSIIFTRRSLVSQLGGFNDVFFANYDDTEFCYRYLKHGYPTFCSSNVVGYHDIPFHATNNNRLLDRGYYIARNRVLFMRLYSKCYPIFLCFLPLWLIYYFRSYQKNKRVRDFKDYLRGTWDGLLFKHNHKTTDVSGSTKI